MKINMQDIKVSDLNSMSLLILSKFARALHEHNGEVIRLHNPNVLLEVANYAASVDNAQLRILYQRLKLELRTQLNTSVPNHGNIGALLIEPNLKERILRRKKSTHSRPKFLI